MPIRAKKNNGYFKGRDLISVNDLSKNDILHVLQIAQKFEKKVNPSLLKGLIAATLFFEPSTRTHQSFSSAAQKLGAGVIGFDNPDATSIKKGESFEDTIRIMANISDIIIVRHPQPGSAKIAADTVNIPIINGGDGPANHPTQTLLDLLTMQKIFKRLDNLKIAFVGDMLHYRTFHGLFTAMAKFSNNKVFGICPKGLEMPDEFRDSSYKDIVISMKDLDETLGELKPDVVCVGRIPKEYIEGDAKKYDFQITAKTVKKLPSKSIIMHPLPRVNEIATEVDKFPNAVYFEQAKNGLYVREALLALMLGKA